MSGQEVWTVQKLVQWTTSHFTLKQIESPRLDAELLLAHALKCKRLDLYLNFEKPVHPAELAFFRELVKRRALREPLAYIVGTQEFYGRAFTVAPGVLIPRPETEHLVDEVLDFFNSGAFAERPSLIDIGTGSGCVGLTLASEMKNLQVTCLDISKEAIETASSNALSLGVRERVQFCNIDFEKFDESNERFHVVASNPPYVGRKGSEILSVEVREHEPSEALFGGDLGYELIERWVPMMTRLLRPGGLLISEIGSDQGDIVEKIFHSQKNLGEVAVKRDYSGHSRIVRGIKNG